MAIIVLFGVRGSGKDTIGDLLVKHYGFGKDSFAGPIKEMVKLAFPEFNDEDLYGDSWRRELQYPQYPFSGVCMQCGSLTSKVDDRTYRCDACPVANTTVNYPAFINPRVALQTLGTEWGRRLSTNIWIDGAFARIKERLDRVHEMRKQATVEASEHFVITDGRFVNEQNRSTKLGAKTVLLLRKLEDSAKASHASEAELAQIPRDRFHYVLDNTGSLEDLPGRVRAMLKDLDIAQTDTEIPY